MYEKTCTNENFHRDINMVVVEQRGNKENEVPFVLRWISMENGLVARFGLDIPEEKMRKKLYEKHGAKKRWWFLF